MPRRIYDGPPCPKCGSSNIDAFVRVVCQDCGAKTKRVWTGEAQSEIRAAMSLWRAGEIMTEDEAREEEEFTKRLQLKVRSQPAQNVGCLAIEMKESEE